MDTKLYTDEELKKLRDMPKKSPIQGRAGSKNPKTDLATANVTSHWPVLGRYGFPSIYGRICTTMRTSRAGYSLYLTAEPL